MTLPVAGTVKTLSACRSCYESALSHLRDVARENDKESPASDTRTSPPNRPKASASHAPTSGFPLARSELLVSISRKAGHIANEQGALELNEAVEMLGGADKGIPHVCYSSIDVVWPVLCCAIAVVPNLSLTMYPFSISTDEHVPVKFPVTKHFMVIIHRYML